VVNEDAGENNGAFVLFVVDGADIRSMRGVPEGLACDGSEGSGSDANLAKGVGVFSTDSTVARRRFACGRRLDASSKT